MAGGNIGNGLQIALRGDIVSLKVKTAVRIMRGSLVAVDSTGYAVPAADTATHVFMGIAEEEANNTSGASGDIQVRVRRRGLAILISTVATAQTHVGVLVYADVAQSASVDQLVDISANVANAVRVGRVLKRVADDEAASTLAYTQKKLLVDFSPGA